MAVASLSPPVEDMERVVGVKTDAIKQACDLATEVMRFDIDGLVAGFADHDYGGEVEAIAQRQSRLLAVAARYHALQLKQVMLLERYTRFILEQNQFWLDVRQGKYHKV